LSSITATEGLMLAREGGAPGQVNVDQLVIAGWTGRDKQALEKHIRELEAIGVQRPRRTPIFYRVSASLLTIASHIEVIGGDSSGEVEFVLFSLPDGLWVGVGSDHTDRKAEALGVTLSKQLCSKPVGTTLWRYSDIAPHWDRLVLRSFAHAGAARRLYQEGPVSAIRSPEDLMKLYSGGALPAGSAMFCGTFAVHGGIEPAATFEMELEDPVRGRKLTHRYEVSRLPIEG
jgi:hypothetical protein